MAKLDPELITHLEWLGYVRPTGLVVSATALVRAGAILNRRDLKGHEIFRAQVAEVDVSRAEQPDHHVPDFQRFAREFLGWSFSPRAYAGTENLPIPDELKVPLLEYGEVLSPTFAVRELEPVDGSPAWQLLVQVLPVDEDLDSVSTRTGRLEASPHGRMERLLRQTGVSAGLLTNGRILRLLSAPRGESSGWIDFRVGDMIGTAGRPMVAALRLLLDQPRLLSLERSKRLPALLEDSRRFQNEVSEQLAQQVLHALYELLRGFQSAHDQTRGELLRLYLQDDPDEVYRGLLTVLLRLVFLLYAEERDLLPESETFLRHYSLSGLHSRLREDAALYPDTMDQRFGAWAHLLVLFRMVHDGALADDLHLPRRHGVLFDPDRFPFLEGRTTRTTRQIHERIPVPLVPDGTVLRALENLLILDGEHLSYRALDVEQIGSVYETMMGFRLETATGPSVAIRAPKPSGAPTSIDLQTLLSKSASEREKWFKDQTGRKLSPRTKTAVKTATDIDQMVAALHDLIDVRATPHPVPLGAMILQPSAERRKSGSHYTPRELTEPIVRHTLEPILQHLKHGTRQPPRARELLELKVCDPAMGSGAFLVEVCRHLGDVLVESWRFYGDRPALPMDEDEVVFARRLVAQRCLYGVDRNHVAVDLAKMSLWLVTLAKDHALTFVDHALRHGDSLVGLSKNQIANFHWDTKTTWQSPFRRTMAEAANRVSSLRQQIRTADESVSDLERRHLWDNTLHALHQVRLYGDLAVAAFFEAEKLRDREKKRSTIVAAIKQGQEGTYRAWLDEKRAADPPLVPFHWEIEFPEVFERPNPGFDAVVGNPPFAGKNTITEANSPYYLDWLKEVHAESHGNADLVAHFFRRSFSLLRHTGNFGLIATNTIGQGDTRATGLRWICLNGGTLYRATRRVRWPGSAAVVISVIHGHKGEFTGPRTLDYRRVDEITAFLFHRGGSEDPVRLRANAAQSFVGTYVLGMGFTFDDTDRNGVASPLAEMHRLIAKDPRNQEVIFPYIGGEEVNTSPTHSHHRYVINFGERSEEECRANWPDLLAIVEAKVKGTRGAHSTAEWWQFERIRAELMSKTGNLQRVLALPQTSNSLSASFLRTNQVYAHTLIVIPYEGCSMFAVINSRIHFIWSTFNGPTIKDDLRYTPSDCFETFPFPPNWHSRPEFETAGKTYYEFRAALMIQNNEGLTKTYNRFHDPEENDPQILRLRELHEVMDRVVLAAYGWNDLPTRCEFLLDYNDEEDEEDSGRTRRKPWRYRWPDEVRDEVLARLLELNAVRAREEAQIQSTGVPTKKRAAKKSSTRPRVRRRNNSDTDTGDLFS